MSETTVLKPKNLRVCECCKGTYATGKEYGDYWHQMAAEGVEVKGLCEFCNPNCELWYTPNMRCHATKNV